MLVFIPSLIVILVGFFSKDPLFINLGLLLCLITFIVKSILTPRVEDKINPIFLFSVGKSITSIGNMLGIYFENDPENKWNYWYYANEKYLFEASLIHVMGTLILIIGYEVYMKNLRNIKPLPKLNFQINTDWFIKYDLYIWAFILLTQNPFYTLPFPPRLVNLFLSLFIFIYAYLSQRHEKKIFFFMRGYILVVILTVNAYLYSFLRVESINPSILFIIGLIWGGGGTKVLRSYALAPVYFFLIIFGLSFNQLGGENRQDIEAKNEILTNTFWGIWELNFDTRKVDIWEDDEGDGKSIWGRMANFNQLTKVVEVQERDGYYDGETIAYLSYAWIPRVLWPDKPIIAAGRWFALTANLAYIDNEGNINNSIDMTPAGELYLNFGYLGIIVGCFMLGIFWAVLWKSCNFFSEKMNLTGIMFGAYLLNQAYWQLGADLQVIITALSMYVTVLIIDKVLNKVVNTSKAII